MLVRFVIYLINEYCIIIIIIIIIILLVLYELSTNAVNIAWHPLQNFPMMGIPRFFFAVGKFHGNIHRFARFST